MLVRLRHVLAIVFLALLPCQGCVVDEGRGTPGGQAPSTVPCTIETVRTNTVEIFRYEASRPDATRTSQGVASDRVCARAGVLPWTGISIADALAACKSAGFRLCTKTEWQRACGGPYLRRYPYGDAEVAHTCNDFLNGSDGPRPAGEMDRCVSEYDAYDMVGNVWEWAYLDEWDPETGESTYKEAYFGGSYKVSQMTRSLHPTQCASRVEGAAAGYKADDVGFRCCRSLSP